MILPRLYPKPSIKDLSGKRRNWAKMNKYYLTPDDRITSETLLRQLKVVEFEMKKMIALVRGHKVGMSAIRRLRTLRQYLFLRYLESTTLPFNVKTEDIGGEVRGRAATIDGWEDIRVPEDFRVDTKQELRSLYAGFQFPDKVVTPSRHVFTGEECFLFGLYHLCNITKFDNEIIKIRFGFTKVLASFCFKAFLSHMINNWGYLLTNNMDFWVPTMRGCSNAINEKCMEYGLDMGDNFNICGFTDNTMNSSCRPGGGPRQPGVLADRNDPLIQRAWYNGWKKLHGLKFQTIDLPNGMNAHVWGPFSVRHNDNWSLTNSNLNEILRVAQLGNRMQYNIYGDSAYMHLDLSHIRARHNYDRLTEREKLENRVMSSCREIIEWDYGDIGRYFPLVDWRHVLKIRQMPVGDICLTAMLYRNALNCIKPNNTAQFFRCRPPHLHEWLSQGPRARPHIKPVITIPP